MAVVSAMLFPEMVAKFHQPTYTYPKSIPMTFSNDIPMISPWPASNPHYFSIFPMFSHCFSNVFPTFFSVFPMFFQFSNVFPMFFQFSNVFPNVFPMFSNKFPHVFPSAPPKSLPSQAALRAWSPRTTRHRQIPRPRWPLWPGTADISARAWQVRNLSHEWELLRGIMGICAQLDGHK